MKKSLFLWLHVAAVFLVSSANSICFSQGTTTPITNTTISTNSNGYYEFLPEGYNNAGNTQTYPLIIFLSGHGAVGDGSPAQIENVGETGPFYYLKRGAFPNRASINNFIMVAPQWFNWDASPTHVNEVINYMIARYRVNINKIYLTGISSGGGVAYNYAGSSLTNARRIAAMVNFAPATNFPFDVTGPTQQKGNIIAEADVAVWGFHFTDDPNIPFSTTTQQWIQFINNPTPPVTPPTPLADSTTPSGIVQHDIWSDVYFGQPFFFHAPTQSALLNGLNMFDWLNQFTRSANSTLPVNFSLFNARCNSGQIHLQWKTAAEQNSRSFSVEKSSDGSTWTEVASVAAAGQSTTERTYTYTDNSAGNQLYRIVAHDRDGRKTISSIVRSNCGSKEVFSVFPNPVKEKAIVSVQLDAGTKVKVMIHDNRGALVYATEAILPAGNNQVPISMNALPKGSYTLTAQWNNERKTTKLIKE